MDGDVILHVIASNIGNPVVILERHPTLSNRQALMMALVPNVNLPREKPKIVSICDRSGSIAGESPNLQPALCLSTTRRENGREGWTASARPARASANSTASQAILPPTFKDLAMAASAADYSADTVFDRDDTRLITHVVKIADIFGGEY
ncbi:hypothetical protein DL764_004573 [Monosporascus ibericus]|uniref:Uncharacterized protein n=1 Tax=Monosporascus ibericus TaxID=155417 RepID=A0A4Q4TFH0_9PEZI|nr:hypothetical protein DL764_004573 [Monosporascus ibericus]